MAGLRVREHRGWEVVELHSHIVKATVVPGKGGDVVSLRWLPLDVEVLWQSPWGLRQRGSLTTSGDSVVRLMEAYPGGWQTVFPNGGDAVHEHGVEWGMHGEVWLTPFDWEPDGATAIVMHARLVRSPFTVVKRVALDGARLIVTETVTNEGAQPLEVMWSQHPAFGAPLVSPHARVETAARTFIVDDARDTPSADLALGARGRWPYVRGRGGETVDLSRIPAPDARVDRMGYLTDFDRGFAAVINPRLGLAAHLTWDATVLPCAWYWLEAHGTASFPWYGAVYVLAIEPATSYPAQGLHAVRAKTGTQRTISPGQSRSLSVSLTLTTDTMPHRNDR